MKKKIRVGSRESTLAMTQTTWVINEIKKKYQNLEFEIVGIKTKGDMVLDTRLDKIGGKGLFIKELENALINKTIDFAVHSLKDIPVCLPDELAITAVSKREDPRDALVTLSGACISELGKGAVIGTSSVRREVQIHLIRPDLEFKTLRGNVNTRLDKLLKNEYDAVVLAAAGLNRLGLGDKIVQYFDMGMMIPAVCQGILAIETRRGEDIDFLLESVHCEEAALQARAERAFMIRLNGGCTTPMAAHAIIEGQMMKIYGMLASEDKSKVCKASLEGSKSDAESLGIKLADTLYEQIKSGGKQR